MLALFLPAVVATFACAVTPNTSSGVVPHATSPCASLSGLLLSGMATPHARVRNERLANSTFRSRPLCENPVFDLSASTETEAVQIVGEVHRPGVALFDFGAGFVFFAKG